MFRISYLLYITRLPVNYPRKPHVALFSLTRLHCIRFRIMQFAVWGQRLTIRSQVILQLLYNIADRSRHERLTLFMNLTLGNFQRHAILHALR